MRLRNQPAGGQDTLTTGGERWRLDAKTGGGILVDHGWHVFYLAHWLMGGAMPIGISAHLGSSPSGKAEDTADLRIEFPRNRIAHAHLSWQSGNVEDHAMADSPDDSYHPMWLAGVAAEFEQAVIRGPESPALRENHKEVRAATALIAGARASAAKGGGRVALA
jgi:hypothetical protein